MGISLKLHPLSLLSGQHKNDGTRLRLLGILFGLLQVDDDVDDDGDDVVVLHDWLLLFSTSINKSCPLLYATTYGWTGVNNGVDCVNESAWNKSGNVTSCDFSGIVRLFSTLMFLIPRGKLRIERICWSPSPSRSANRDNRRERFISKEIWEDNTIQWWKDVLKTDERHEKLSFKRCEKTHDCTIVAQENEESWRRSDLLMTHVGTHHTTSDTRKGSEPNHHQINYPLLNCMKYRLFSHASNAGQKRINSLEIVRWWIITKYTMYKSKK